MNRTTFRFVFAVLSAAMLVLSVGRGHAQTPGRIPMFAQPLTGSCHASTGNDCVDSVITQDPNGNIGIGTAPNEQLEITGNLRLPPSTATAGVIKSGAEPFIHNFGSFNFFAGVYAGNFSLTGIANTGVGVAALLSNTTGYFNTAMGVGALQFNTTGHNNSAIGFEALWANTTGSDNTAIGDSVLHANTIGFGNTAGGRFALWGNTTGSLNTASGEFALGNNTTGDNNTANGERALSNNTAGSSNTAIGARANVCPALGCGNLTNATAIGAGAIVDASHKIRLGNDQVTLVEGPPYSTISDRNQKENFQPVDGEQLLRKIADVSVTTWNYIGHDPKQFRHYGPVSQDFFAAFGHDGIGTVGTPTTISAVDMAGILMIAVQALERRTTELMALRAENAEVKARVEALERLVKQDTEAISASPARSSSPGAASGATHRAGE